MSGEFFSRYELKYLINWETYQQLALELLPYTTYDPRGKEGRRYNIVTLYFESPDNRIYHETVNKLQFRQKLRLRVYNNVTVEDQAFFEIKQKYKRVVNKRRTRILLKDAYDFITSYPYHTDLLDDLDVSNMQIMKEIQSFKELYDLSPKLIVSYDRQAFQGIYDEDLRVTFDYNLMCRDHNLRIEHGPQGGSFVDTHQVIMEVKVTHSVPLWLSRLLSEFACNKKSVSKFCSSTDHCDALKKEAATYEPGLLRRISQPS